MKKLRIISFVFTVGLVNALQTQFTQIELISGFDKTDFTSNSSYFINERKALSINTLAYFQKYNDDENKGFDEAGVQPTLFWNNNEHISIGPSLYYNSIAGYSRRLSTKFILKNIHLLLVVIPSVAHSEKMDAGYAEAFAQY
ncbi:hypothetical protein [Mangrovivirga cuniculi]|uniref:hypothetical protein n=1 Tax=Mangrovivirga cuniculi TaxID=2715131 RepID=UPI001FE60166|nr:hypothetical protein [Mangrovivirga cuniculi]